MREMKDSGIEWIGEIPASWNILKLKYICSKIERGTAPNYTDTPITRVVNQATFSKGYFDNSNIRYSTIPAATSRGLLKVEDVLLASTGGGVLGKTHYFTESDEYVADSHITIVRALPAIAVGRFIYYCFFVNFDLFNATMAKGSTNQTELQRDLLANMQLPLPNIAEQEKIVSFLNFKCSEIDTISADIQKEIEILEQYKRSVITEAVTKGLNPDVEMKNSGMAWCRQIPAHWEPIPSKHLFHNSDTRKYPNDELLTASQKYGVISQTDYMLRENASVVMANKGIENWKHIEPNDFVISLRSFQGGLEMSEITGCVTWHYVVLKASKQLYPRYFKWLFKSSKYINALQSTCNFIRDGQDLRFSNFAKVPLFEPPYSEQVKISNYLDNKVTSIEYALADKKKQLAVIDSYKKSLIYEYVTGKKEVPVQN